MHIQAVKTIVALIGDENESPDVRRAAARVLHACVDVDELATVYLLQSEIDTAKGTCMRAQACAYVHVCMCVCVSMPV